MISKIQKRFMSTWIKEKLASNSATTGKTLAIVVDHSEIQNNSLEFIKDLTASQHFRQDLNLSNSYWFYHPSTQARTLLLQYKQKENAKPEEIKASIRALGVRAAQEL